MHIQSAHRPSVLRYVALIIALALIPLGVPHAKSDLKGLRILQVVPPEYPPVARRYNIQGTVTVQLMIGIDGRVHETQIIESPADVLSDAVRRVTPKWLFSNPVSPTSIALDVPFKFTEPGDAAFSYSVRSLTSMPKEKNELGKKAISGWADVRIIVGTGDRSRDFYVARISDAKFRKTIEEVIKRLRFAEVAPDGKLGWVNILQVRVSDNTIEIEQLPGG
jgi:TonB family protein